MNGHRFSVCHLLFLILISYSFININPASSEQINNMSLGLKAASKPIVQGELFTVDLYLYNIKKKAFDSLYVWLKYDPKVIQVLEIDYDPNDLIIREIEMQQISSTEQFPLSFMVTNRVDNSRGEIDFRLETVGPSVVVEGIFARITFKAIEKNEETRIQFLFNEWGKHPTTAVLCEGRDVLGPDFIHGNWAKDLRITIFNHDQ